METKHTPTPWRVGDAGATVFGPKTDSPSPKTIATVSVHTVIGEENKANAAFIVRAVNAYEQDQEIKKDLLRVCKMIYDFDNEQDKFAEPWMIELGEVIAKAEPSK